MRGYNFDVLDYTLSTIAMLGGSLVNLGNNSGLPEIVRNELRMAGEGLNSSMSAAMSMRNSAIAQGWGPISTGLRASVEWLGTNASDKCLDNLAVFHPLKPADADINESCKRWSQFFITQFPRDKFCPDNGTLEIKTRYCNYDIVLTAKLNKEAKYADKLATYIESVSFVINTREKFWTISGEISRNGSLFVPHPFTNRRWSIEHHVEQTKVDAGQCTGDDYTWFADHCLITPLAEHLDMTFDSYHQHPSTGYCTSLEAMFDIKVRRLHAEHRHAAYDILLNWLGRTANKVIVIEELEGIEVKLGRGGTDWHTYSDVVKARTEYSWNRDKALVNVDSIKLDGMDLSRRFLPSQWHDIITEQISKTFDELLATREWPEPDAETEPSQ